MANSISSMQISKQFCFFASPLTCPPSKWKSPKLEQGGLG